MATKSKAQVTRLSQHLEFHQYHPLTTADGKQRPTLIFLPWMTATQSLANRYRELYAARGFNVLTVWGKLSYFIWPKWASPLAVELADYIETQIQGPVVVHSMSIGAYLYAVTLAHIIDNKEKYGNLISRVKGHVYDSVVVGTLDEMAQGVGIILSSNSLLQAAVRRTCLMYFSATEPYTVVPYNKFIDAVYHSPVPTPMLCFYSLTDNLCRPDAMQRLIDTWREKYNLDVTVKCWDKSPHASHLRHDPSGYNEYIDEFLTKTGLGDIAPHLQSKL